MGLKSYHLATPNHVAPIKYQLMFQSTVVMRHAAPISANDIQVVGRLTVNITYSKREIEPNPVIINQFLLYAFCILDSSPNT